MTRKWRKSAAKFKLAKIKNSRFASKKTLFLQENDNYFVTNRNSGGIVKNAHIKRLDKEEEVGNLSRSISHSFLLPSSPADSPQIQRHQLFDSSPKISKANSKLALLSRRYKYLDSIWTYHKFGACCYVQLIPCYGCYLT